MPENDFGPRFPVRHALEDDRVDRSVVVARGVTLAVVDGAKRSTDVQRKPVLVNSVVLAVFRAIGPPDG